MSCNCSDSQLYSKCCCQECLPPQPSQGPQGVPGEKGDPGTPGQNGVNAYTEVESAGTVPAVGNTVVLSVANAQWVVDGQNIYIEGIGYYEVQSHTDTTITAKNTGAPGNASPGNPIPVGAGVGPAGYEGSPPVSPLPVEDGGTNADNATDAFTNLSPITNQGDIIIGGSGGVPARLAAGTNGRVLTVVSGVPAWQPPSVSAGSITGTLPIANGGTGATTISGARTSLQVPGISANNTFTGNNTFDLTGDYFRIAKSGGYIVEINPTANEWTIDDLSGNTVIDVQNKRILGSWLQTQIPYATANAATYNTWTNVSTVISTYSLTGAQTITLPSGTDGRVVRIIDGAGNASTNNITIARTAFDTILGATSYVLNNNYGAVAFIYNAATTDWKILP
jgi:hypothetical protein